MMMVIKYIDDPFVVSYLNNFLLNVNAKQSSYEKFNLPTYLSQFVFKKLGYSRPLFLYFRIFNTVESTYNFSPMTGFEPGISGVGSNCSTNCATITVISFTIYLWKFCQLWAQFCHFVLDDWLHTGSAKSKVFQIPQQESALLPPVLSRCANDSRRLFLVFILEGLPTWPALIVGSKRRPVGDVVTFKKFWNVLKKDILDKGRGDDGQWSAC